MSVDYTHPVLGEEVEAVAGYYLPQRELRLRYGGREVPGVIGRVSVEASCCGARDWAYARVSGYVDRWHYARAASGQPVSAVTPLTGKAARQAVRALVTAEAGQSINVEF